MADIYDHLKDGNNAARKFFFSYIIFGEDDGTSDQPSAHLRSIAKLFLNLIKLVDVVDIIIVSDVKVYQRLLDNTIQ